MGWLILEELDMIQTSRQFVSTLRRSVELCDSSLSRHCRARRTVTSGNVPSDMCAQRRQISLRIRAVWSEPSLSSCRNFSSLAIQKSLNRSVKVLIRLRECAGWSESSLGVHVRFYLSPCGSHKSLQFSFPVNAVENWDGPLMWIINKSSQDLRKLSFVEIIHRKQNFGDNLNLNSYFLWKKKETYRCGF